MKCYLPHGKTLLLLLASQCLFVSGAIAASPNSEPTDLPQKPPTIQQVSTSAPSNEADVLNGLSFSGNTPSAQLSQPNSPANTAPGLQLSAQERQATVPVVSPPNATNREEWASTTLRSLATRYNCSPNVLQTSRSLSRAEFASGLLDCISKMEGVIANRDSSSQEDIAALAALQQEFASELATLIIRLDEKADRSTQFSTTVKLTVEAIFAAADTFGDRNGTDPTVPVFGYRARLNFNGSLTGQDQFRIRLQARDVPQFNTSTGTNMARLGFDGQGGNTTTIDEFFYKFPVGPQTRVSLIANAHGSENLAPNLSPISSSGRGALSRFARFSPIYRLLENTGVAVEHNFSDQFSGTVAYRVSRATTQTPGSGLFNGNYGIFTQLTYRPTPAFAVGAQYVNAYYPAGFAGAAGSTGSAFAQQPFAANTATQTDTFGIVSSYTFSPQFVLYGSAAFGNARGQSGTDIGRNASLATWMFTLGFPDLGQRGNYGALTVGMPFKVTSNDVATRRDPSESLHIEASYRHQISDNVAITPGFFVITNPEHNSANPTQVIGVVRTTLTF